MNTLRIAVIAILCTGANATEPVSSISHKQALEKVRAVAAAPCAHICVRGPVQKTAGAWPLNSVVRLHPTTMSETCPKCSAPVTSHPKTSQFLAAWFLGDLSGTVITVLIVVAFACVGSDQSAIAMVLGGVAAAIIFFKLWRRAAREQRSRGVFECAKCGYTQTGERAGAI
jgi:hypothetical protein